VDDAVDEQGRRAQYLARSQAAVDILAAPVRNRDAGPVPVEHRHVEAELGGVPEQITVSSAFRRWNSTRACPRTGSAAHRLSCGSGSGGVRADAGQRKCPNASCVAPYQLR